jgi:hypothetical protein
VASGPSSQPLELGPLCPCSWPRSWQTQSITSNCMSHDIIPAMETSTVVGRNRSARPDRFNQPLRAHDRRLVSRGTTSHAAALPRTVPRVSASRTLVQVRMRFPSQCPREWVVIDVEPGPPPATAFFSPKRLPKGVALLLSGLPSLQSGWLSSSPPSSFPSSSYLFLSLSPVLIVTLPLSI